MGANASGKTSIGRMLLNILNFIARKEYASIASCINDSKKDAKFEIQFVVNDDFYRVSSIIKGKKVSKNYSSSDFLIKVEQIEIGKSDTYEKTLEKLDSNQTPVTAVTTSENWKKLNQCHGLLSFQGTVKIWQQAIPQKMKKDICRF